MLDPSKRLCNTDNAKENRPAQSGGKTYRRPGFSVRLALAERREIERAIKKNGNDKSEWIRSALLAKARQQMKTYPELRRQNGGNKERQVK